MCVDWGGDNDRIDRINFGGLDVIIIKKRVNDVFKAMFRGGKNLLPHAPPIAVTNQDKSHKERGWNIIIWFFNKKLYNTFNSFKRRRKRKASWPRARVKRCASSDNL